MGRLFGTDGVRGIANRELTCELACDIGRAAATVLSNGEDKLTFIIGSDTRASSDMITCAISSGLCSVGANVINLGVMPTPAIAYLVTKYHADAGIMISASHNPAEFNGIKIFNSYGFKLADMLEERIEEIVLDKKLHVKFADGKKIGRITYSNTALFDYIEFIKSTIDISLDDLKIALDCANGSASVTAKEIFEGLGADVKILNATPNGTNINLNCGSTHIAPLADYVVKNNFDCGIAFDGDADRCLFVDESGNLIDGDMIMAICALHLSNIGKLNKNTVVGTILSNFGLTKFCDENNLKFVPTKVGDRYVLEEMLLEDYSFGGEQSGHIIFRDFATTGDGQLTAVQMLARIKSENKKVSELAAIMKKYPQVEINIKVPSDGKIAFYNNKIIEYKLDEAKKRISSKGRIVVRPSGTEPLIRVMVEGDDSCEIKCIAEEMAEIIKKQLSE